jgi:hypothetical protein
MEVPSLCFQSCGERFGSRSKLPLVRDIGDPHGLDSRPPWPASPGITKQQAARRLGKGGRGKNFRKSGFGASELCPHNRQQHRDGKQDQAGSSLNPGNTRTVIPQDPRPNLQSQIRGREKREKEHSRVEGIPSRGKTGGFVLGGPPGSTHSCSHQLRAAAKPQDTALA